MVSGLVALDSAERRARMLGQSGIHLSANGRLLLRPPKSLACRSGVTLDAPLADKWLRGDTRQVAEREVA